MADGVRPQALYVNLNNQAFPVVGVSDQSTSISSTTIMSRSQNELQMPLIGSALAPAVPNLSAVAPGMALGMQPQVMSQMPTPSVMNLRSVATNGAAQSRASGTQLTSALPQHPQVSLPGYNLQPPTFQTPHTAQPSHRIPQGQPIAQSIQSASASSDAPIPLTNVPAYQIRIGSRKFKPLSTVQFKEDGVLFTLKSESHILALPLDPFTLCFIWRLTQTSLFTPYRLYICSCAAECQSHYSLQGQPEVYALPSDSALP